MNTEYRTEYKNVQQHRFNPTHGRTHPIVLIAATGLTIFSILGSAAITGLLPVNHQSQGELGGILTERAVILPLPSPEMSRAGSHQSQQNQPGKHESSYEKTSESGNPVQSKEFVRLRANRPLVLG